ncbi:Tim44 domain-containing protein [Thiobacillus sp.]
MKRLLISLFALFISFGFVMQDAEARRLGGGKSFGMQRSILPKKTVNPAPQPPQQAGAPSQATPQKRGWMGPVAGLAAGLGLAALASHFGMGEGMANVLMLALLAMAAFMLIRFLMRRNASNVPAMQYAGAPVAGMSPASTGFAQIPPGTFGGSTRSAAFPPGFDPDAFAREAKLNFIRLQAAFDASNLDDLRTFTTPEVFAEVRMQLAERGNVEQTTDVMALDVEVLDAGDADNRHVVSVRFTGLIREAIDQDAAPLNEVWHLSKPVHGQGGWVIAGIQQE